MKRKCCRKQKILRLTLITIIFLLGNFIAAVKSEADAIRSNESGDASSIGTYSTTVGGYSYVGVKVYWEDELECFALDTYQRNSTNNLLYVNSNVDGEISNAGYGTTGEYISLLYRNSSNYRFMLKNDVLARGREDYSMTVECYLKGNLISTQYGIPGVPNGEHGCNLENRFLLSNERTYLSSHDGDSRSYVYRIYDPRIIEPQGEELSLNTCGGKMESTGKAYVSKEGLRLVTLPVVSMKKTGYDCVFEGWYNKVQGGEKYKVGDILQKGDVLYAHWKVTPGKFNVTCIDVRGDNPGGTVLGQSTWLADYGTETSAGNAGTKKDVGAYYPHCYYKEGTKATVTEKGATVYRYFSYESCPVEYVDQIKDGTRAGEVLNRVTQKKEYSSTVKGTDLGLDHTPNAYYEGYYYDTFTSTVVKEQGNVVYRYFKPVKYTVILDGNGGEDDAMITRYDTEYDKEVALKKNRFKKTCTLKLHENLGVQSEEINELSVKQRFLGWSLERNGSVRFADSDTIKNLTNKNEDVTLYAVWSEETVQLPALSARGGYRFLGWAKDADAKTGMMQMTIQDSGPLYAIWEKELVKYHVEYYKENLAGEYELASNYQFDGYVDEEASIDSVDSVYPGFSLDKASSKLSGLIKADGSLILCAYYRRNTYQLSYDLNGGMLQSGEALDSEKAAFGMNRKLASPIPKREGYIFQGWYQESDDTHTIYQPGDTFVMQNHDVVLHAQWKQLAFPIIYDKNEKASGILDISGEVPPTDYAYQKDSYASSKVYQSAYGEMISWNTKPDGSGIEILPGANLKGLFDTESSLTLYAIWKSVENPNDAAFQIRISMEKDGKTEIADTLKLHGRAGETIRSALLRLYQKELRGESVIYFYKGYEVTNEQELEQLISVNSDTNVTLSVIERKCEVTFLVGEGENEKNITGITGKYQDTYTLPDSLSDGQKVERYEDNMGNHYYPGDTITLDRNLKLSVQQAIHLLDENGKEKESIDYITRGKDYVLPDLKKDGYRFLGWYNSLGELIGAPGDVIKDITKRCDYYAKWSEPLTYTISYDLGDTGIKILENKVLYHQYTKDTILPNKTQVIVPDGYQFKGWYYRSDASKALLTKIAATEFGDKVLCPLVVRLTDSENDKNKDNMAEDDKNNKDNTTDNDKNNKDDKTDKDNNQSSNNESNQGNSNTQGNPNGILPKPDDDKTDGISGIKKQPNEDKLYAVGNIFWKGKVKYKIVSVQNGTGKVTVIGVKKKAKKIIVPARVTYQNIRFSVTAIGKRAFFGAKKLKKAVIGNNVERIGNLAFAKAKKLSKVTLGKKIKRIDAKAFYQCRQLKNSVIKSKKLTKIGKKAFPEIQQKGKIRVPASKKKLYRKLLKKSGLKRINIICKIK